MPSYRLYFFTPRAHGIVGLVEFEAPSDDAARQRALKQRGDQALELWAGTRKLAEIPATDLASRVLALRRAQRSGSMGAPVDRAEPHGGAPNPA